MILKTHYLRRDCYHNQTERLLMNHILITNDHNEMIALGKILFEEHREFYSNEIRLRSITDVIDAEMRNATQSEKDDVFFRSLYDYWVYGNSIKEELDSTLRTKHTKKN